MNRHPLLESFAQSVPAFRVALELQDSGNDRQARSAYLDLIDNPQLVAICLHQLGMIAFSRGERDRAIALFQQCVKLDPSLSIAHMNLGALLRQQGRIDESLAIDIDFGCRFQFNKQYDHAIQIYKKVLAITLLNYPAHANIGNCYAWTGKLRSALIHLLNALQLYGRIVPMMADFYSNLVKTLFDKSVFASLSSTLPEGLPNGNLEKVEEVLTSLGKVLTQFECPHEAILCHREAIHYAPGFALAHVNLAIALLAIGEDTEGWREYEWRWSCEGMPEPKRFLPFPTWQGESLTNKRILVWGEQGSGDIIQFAPLVKILSDDALEVVFEVPIQLVRLMQHNMHPLKVIPRPDHPHTLTTNQHFDFVVPLLSLPHLMGLNRTKLPLATHYIRPYPDDINHWAERCPSTGKIKIGVVWAGNPLQMENAKRSVPFAIFSKLFAHHFPIVWYSLQVGEREQDLLSIHQSEKLHNLATYLKDFADTAAAIHHLDLIITVCTAVAHLAGAMGKETWLLLHKVPDWRWSSNSDADTITWYPSLRIFQQQVYNEWDAVIQDVQEALKSWVDGYG